MAERYEVLHLLEDRRTSKVFAATQHGLGRQVVLKLLPRGDDPRAEARFRREAEALARLKHPACVDVFDYGAWEQWLFLVVAWVEGPPLDLVDGHPWAPDEAIGLMIDVARGLEHAHARGVVHRDLSPRRIVLSEGVRGRKRAHMVDFGMARLEDGDVDTTAGGEPKGTPGYLAPERVQGGPGTPAGDVYAVGVMLWEMLAGRHPFRQRKAIETLAVQLASGVPAFPHTDPPLPEALAFVLDRATRSAPAERLQDGGELLRALLAARAALTHPGLALSKPTFSGGKAIIEPALAARADDPTPTLAPRRTALALPPEPRPWPWWAPVLAGAAIAAVVILAGLAVIAGLWLVFG